MPRAAGVANIGQIVRCHSNILMSKFLNFYKFISIHIINKNSNYVHIDIFHYSKNIL